jgi:hypothetical protein
MAEHVSIVALMVAASCQVMSLTVTDKAGAVAIASWLL